LGGVQWRDLNTDERLKVCTTRWSRKERGRRQSTISNLRGTGDARRLGLIETGSGVFLKVCIKNYATGNGKRPKRQSVSLNSGDVSISRLFRGIQKDKWEILYGRVVGSGSFVSSSGQAEVDLGGYLKMSFKRGIILCLTQDPGGKGESDSHAEVLINLDT